MSGLLSISGSIYRKVNANCVRKCEKKRAPKATIGFLGTTGKSTPKVTGSV